MSFLSRAYQRFLSFLLLFSFFSLGVSTAHAGQIYSWGTGNAGVLGNNSYQNTASAVAVDTSGVLSGQSIMAVAAGYSHNLALDSNGHLYSWGSNQTGALGNGTNQDSSVPVAVDMSGALAGKTVTNIAVGIMRSLALTSDGQVFAWGLGQQGELGNGSTQSSNVPVPVIMNGALAGKTVTAIAAGSFVNLALTSDGKLYSWGSSQYGMLGNNSASNTTEPTAVDMTGVLAGKTITKIAVGDNFCLALTSEGKAYSWGVNSRGQLGNPNANGIQNLPIEVSMSGAMSGKTVTAIAAGFEHSLALTSDNKIFAWGSNEAAQLGIGNAPSQPVPAPVVMDGALAGKTVIALAAGRYHSLALTNDGRIFSWGVNPAGQLGNNNFGTYYSATPAPVGTNGYPANATASAISAGAEHNLVIATNKAPSISDIKNKTIAKNGWTDQIPFTIADESLESLTVTATSNNPNLVAQPGIYLVGTGTNRAITVVPTHDQTGQATITVTVSDGNLSTSDSFVLRVTSNTVNPEPWTEGKLTYWGSQAWYSNLPMAADPDGVLTNKTVAAVTGSYGHSLALTTDGKVYAWGSNHKGQLGIGSYINGTATPSLVDMSGALSGKTVIAIAAGDFHSLALTSDGKVYAWGENQNGQLGTTPSAGSRVPVAVTAGVMGSKKVIAVAAGAFHNLALTEDGQVYSWGSNIYNVLGTATVGPPGVVAAVDTSGVLSGKTVTAIRASQTFNLVLTSDGQIFGWGNNYYGQLGNGNNYDQPLPVAVLMDGALSGKTITAISSGSGHGLALTSEGQIFSWGENAHGQLGVGNETHSYVPIAVDTSGALAGKTISAISASGYHNLVLDSNGRVYSWGNNSYVQLGRNDGSNSVPGPVDTSGILKARTVTAISAGSTCSYALTNGDDPNAVPTISDITDQSTGIAQEKTVAFTIGDNETPADELQVTGSSDNQDLMPDANIVIEGTGANRTLRLTPGAGLEGSTTITITVSDGSATSSDWFRLWVTKTNQAPTITEISDQVVFLQQMGSPLSFTIGDEETPADQLTVTAVSSNQDVVADSSLVLDGTGAERTILVPTPAQPGHTTITVTVSDGELSTTEAFQINFETNTPPTLSAIDNQTINVNQSTGALTFSIGDSETPADQLVVFAQSGDNELVPYENIVFGGEGANRTVTVTPAAGKVGETAITLSVNDGFNTTAGSFTLTVIDPNQPPTISAIENQTLAKNRSTADLDFTIGDSDTPVEELTVTATSSNQALVPDISIAITGAGANRKVKVTRAADGTGTATITLTVSDGKLTATSAFELFVTEPADITPPAVTVTAPGHGGFIK